MVATTIFPVIWGQWEILGSRKLNGMGQEPEAETF